MNRVFCLTLVSSVSILSASCGRPTDGQVATQANMAASSGDTPAVALAEREPRERETAKPITADASSLEIFEKRILPIFQAKNPSSCAECHLSGVDLKDYIGPNQEATFASLVANGLVDVKNPDASKLLKFISRRPEKRSLITDKVRQQELTAFRAWIRAAVKDPKLLAAKAGKEPLGPSVSNEVIRHARTDRVLASFLDNIWSEVGRCAACHSPDRNQKQVKQHGAQVSWITLRDPQATLNHLIDSGLIDLDAPEESLLLTKPTLQVEHKGGLKMLVGDRSYKQFRRFIDDYAAVANGTYKTADQLPKAEDEVSFASENWLKVTGVPAEFHKKLLQADVYRRVEAGWSITRWATGDRAVFGPKKLWQQSLSLTAARDSNRGKEIRSRKLRRLPPGRYLVKLYVDRTGKLQKNFRATLGDEEFVGEVEVDTRWPAGYGRMTVVRYPTR
jgi:hypothetical protein